MIVRTAGCTSANSRHPGGSLVGQSSPTGPGGLCPTQAVSGPHGAPRAASHRRPREWREGERPRRPRVAALQAAANGQRFARVPHVLAPNATAERRQRRRWPSPRAFSVACGGPHRTDWPPRGQQSGGLPHSGRGTPAGWGKRGCVCQKISAGCVISVRRVTVELVRVISDPGCMAREI